MTEAHLLVVEDEHSLARTIAFNLTQEGYRVDLARSLSAARQLLATTSFDLLVLDLMLPDGNGLHLLRELRAAGDHIAVLVLTARSGTDEVVVGLQSGADDYLGKPFSLDEFLSRVAALLRRQGWRPSGSQTTARHASFGNNTVDLLTGDAQTARGPTRLTETELRLLRFLIGHHDEDLTRQRLLAEVWEMAVVEGARSRTLDTFVLRLRRMLEIDPAHPLHLRTVFGIGYRFHPGDGASFTS